MTTPHLPPLTEPLHPTVLNVLQNSPAGPLLNQPVENVLAAMGLPALPQLPALPPLPGLPPLPQINPATLVKPITDLFGGFGNGQLGANGAINPQTVLSNVTQGLNTAMSLASAGLSLLSLLQGAGSQAAQSSGTAAAGNASNLATQGTNINSSLGAASATVGEGAGEMAATAAQFLTTMAALGPALVTPMGQAALLGAGVEAGTQATAITAKTKAQLSAHSAVMAQAGTPVQVTAAPTGGGSTSMLSELGQLMSVAQPLLSTAEQGLSTLATQQVATTAAKPLTNIDDKMSSLKAGGAAAGLAAAAGGLAAFGGGGGGGGVSETKPTLTQWSGDKVGAGEAADQAASEALAGDLVPAAAEPMAPMAPMAPMGAGIASARNAGDLAHSSSHQVLVNAAHGNEVVGDIDGVAPPVVGGADWQSDSPDIALTL